MMKYLGAILCICLVFTAGVFAQSNLLLNPSFDIDLNTDGYPDGWNTAGVPAGGAYMDTNGATCLTPPGCMLATNGTGAYPNQDLSAVLEPDTEYIVKGWLNTINASNPSDIFFRLVINGAPVRIGTATAATMPWTQFSSVYTTPSDLGTVNRFDLHFSISSGFARYDDMVLMLGTNTVEDPYFIPGSATYVGAADVQIACARTNVTIYYTTDGSEPTTNDTEYAGSVSLSTTTVVRAKAFREFFDPSGVVTAEFTFVGSIPEPEVSPMTGSYSEFVNVTMTTTIDNAEIYYTLNGAEPTTNDTLYAGTFQVSNIGTNYVRAIAAVQDPYIVSGVSTAVLEVTSDVAPPQISHASGSTPTSFRLLFNEGLDTASVTNPANYAVSGGVTVTNAYLMEDMLTVIVGVDSLTAGVEYTVTVSNVTDDAPTPNQIVTTDVTFTDYEPLAGMAMWLKANAGVTVTNGVVSSWLDYSGNGRDAVQATEANRPVYLSNAREGYPGMRFDGTNDMLTYILPVNGLTGVTVFVASSATRDKAVAGGDYRKYPVLGWEELPVFWGGFRIMPHQTTLAVRFGIGSPSEADVNNPRPSTIGTNWVLTTAWKSGYEEKLYSKGEPLMELTRADAGGLGSYLNNVSPTGHVASGGNWGEWGAYDVVEVLVYTNALTSNEIDQVEAYFNDKYGLLRPGSTAPVITPNNANLTNFVGKLQVVLSNTLAGATIRYTTDGSEPTDSSTEYTEPFLISDTVTVKARAFKDGFDASPVSQQSYNKVDNLIRNPSFTYYEVGDDTDPLAWGLGYQPAGVSHSRSTNVFLTPSASLMFQSTTNLFSYSDQTVYMMSGGVYQIKANIRTHMVTNGGSYARLRIVCLNPVTIFNTEQVNTGTNSDEWVEATLVLTNKLTSGEWRIDALSDFKQTTEEFAWIDDVEITWVGADLPATPYTFSAMDAAVEEDFDDYTGEQAPEHWKQDGSNPYLGVTSTNSFLGGWRAYTNGAGFCFGFKGTGSEPTSAHYAEFKNETGATITNLLVSYDALAVDTSFAQERLIYFFYSTESGTSGYGPFVFDLSFATSMGSQNLSYNLAVEIEDGDSVWIKYELEGGPSSHALGFDNISITPQGEAPAADTDGDGIPDSWEAQYFGGVTNCDASANADADPLTNWEEYIADTNPTNDTSYLDGTVTNMVGSTAGTMVILVGPPTSTERIYDAWKKTNLDAGTWVPLNLDVPGLGPAQPVQLIITNSDDDAYFRTGVKLP